MNRRGFLLSSVAVGALAVSVPAVFSADKDLKIMAGVGGMQFPFFVIMMNNFRDAAKATPGVTLIESDGQNSSTKQTADIEAAIVQNVDAIVFSPLDVAALGPAIQEAIDAHIPVVTVDRQVDKMDGILAHIGADNVKGGEVQGEALMAALPNGGKIFNLQGQPGASPARDRNQGLHNVIDPHKDKYQIVFEQTANWLRDQALSVTEAAFAANGKPDAIVCANDDMAFGVIEACANAGYTDVLIFGFDALPAALDAIREGKLAGTVDQLPGEQSKQALQIAVDFVRNGTKPAQQVTLLTPLAITKANVG